MSDKNMPIHREGLLPAAKVRPAGRADNRCCALPVSRLFPDKNGRQVPGKWAGMDDTREADGAVVPLKKAAEAPIPENGTGPDGTGTENRRKALIDQILRDPQKDIDRLIARIRKQNAAPIAGRPSYGCGTANSQKGDTKHIDFYCSNLSGSTRRPESNFDRQAGLAVRQTMDRYGQVRLSSRGRSMYPYIKEGDSCTFLARDAAFLNRGDVLLYQDPAGALIAHRFIGTRRDACGLTVYILKGDSNLKSDSPVYAGQIFGIMTKIEPAGRKFRLSHIFCRSWQRLVMDFPLMSRCLNKYLTFRRMF